MYILKYKDDDKIGFLKGEDGWVYYPRTGPIDPKGSTLFTKGERDLMLKRDELGPNEKFIWYGAYLPLKEL